MGCHFVFDEVEASILRSVEGRHAIDHEIAFPRHADRPAYLLFLKGHAQQVKFLR